MTLFLIIYVSVISIVVIGGGAWFIVRTKKMRHYIRVFVHMPDDRIKYYVTKPQGESVTVGKPALTFLLTKDKPALWKGLPTYNYRFDNIFPLQIPEAAESGEPTATPLVMNAAEKSLPIAEIIDAKPRKIKTAAAVNINPKKEQSPAQLAAFKRSLFLQKVLESSNATARIALEGVLSIIVLGVVLGIAYFMYTSGQEIIEKLDYIIGLLSGGGL